MVPVPFSCGVAVGSLGIIPSFGDNTDVSPASSPSAPSSATATDPSAASAASAAPTPANSAPSRSRKPVAVSPREGVGGVESHAHRLHRHQRPAQPRHRHQHQTQHLARHAPAA